MGAGLRRRCDGVACRLGADVARPLPASAENDDAKLFGAAKVKTANLAPIAAALGLAPANGGALGPADVGFDATLRGDRWTFSRLAATIAGLRASGELTYDPVATLSPAAQASAEISGAEEALGSGAAAARSPRLRSAEIEGELTVDRMPLAGILALALGPPQPGRTGSRWSEAKFAPAPLRPPSAAVKLRVGTLDLTDALSAQGFAATLRFDKGRLDLDDFTMQIAGGAASGHATLRRDADTATLTGRADRRLGRRRTARILGPRRRSARFRLDRAQSRRADRGARRRRDGELHRRGAGAKRSCRSRSRGRQGADPRRAA